MYVNVNVIFGKLFIQCSEFNPRQGTVVYNSDLLLLFLYDTSPWYNHTGWLGVKHQVTYLPPWQIKNWKRTASAHISGN